MFLWLERPVFSGVFLGLFEPVLRLAPLDLHFQPKATETTKKLLGSFWVLVLLTHILYCILYVTDYIYIYILQIYVCMICICFLTFFTGDKRSFLLPL